MSFKDIETMVLPRVSPLESREIALWRRKPQPIPIETPVDSDKLTKKLNELKIKQLNHGNIKSVMKNVFGNNISDVQFVRLRFCLFAYFNEQNKLEREKICERINSNFESGHLPG